MSKPDNVIKLLLIEDSVDEAEQIISMLRNGGIALRPTRAANEAELEDLLERQPPDMILANLGSRDLPLRQAAEAVNRCGKDISM
ncbi:MAG: diguanylate cyclase, partial [Dokdonella sp.]